jgi:hypothetical protein
MGDGEKEGDHRLGGFSLTIRSNGARPSFLKSKCYFDKYHKTVYPKAANAWVRSLSELEGEKK